MKDDFKSSRIESCITLKKYVNYVTHNNLICSLIPNKHFYP